MKEEFKKANKKFNEIIKLENQYRKEFKKKFHSRGTK